MTLDLITAIILFIIIMFVWPRSRNKEIRKDCPEECPSNGRCKSSIIIYGGVMRKDPFKCELLKKRLRELKKKDITNNKK